MKNIVIIPVFFLSFMLGTANASADVAALLKPEIPASFLVAAHGRIQILLLNSFGIFHYQVVYMPTIILFMSMLIKER